MQATLIYNGNSGSAESVSADDLQAALGDAGFSPVYEKTEEESDLDEVLKDIEGLVVTAGGDGTVRAVATRLVASGQNEKVALAILPLGTANNIGNTLGLNGSSPKEIIQSLQDPRKYTLDIGHVTAPWGENYFIEAFGCGLFADLLTDYDPEEGKSVLRALDTVGDVLADYDPHRWQLSLDGEDLSDEYIAVEVLNMKATGPRLKLAPDADPTDGLFDVACVVEPDNTTFFDYLAGLVSDNFDALENVSVLRGKKLELTWDGFPIHVDAELRPERVTELDDVEEQTLDKSGTLSVEIIPQALELWLPPECEG